MAPTSAQPSNTRYLRVWRNPATLVCARDVLFVTAAAALRLSTITPKVRSGEVYDTAALVNSQPRVQEWRALCAWTAGVSPSLLPQRSDSRQPTACWHAQKDG